MKIETHPLTPDRWDDLDALFKTNSITRNCWCMWFRQTTDEARRFGGAQNRHAFRKIVQTAEVPPGILAYVDGKPAGWCAIAPREDYPRIERSRNVKPIDDEPAWSIVCFFIAKDARGAGLSRRLTDAAVDLAQKHGAKLVEAYPVDPAQGPLTPDQAYYGLQPAFERAGFEEALRRTPKRPIMRRRL
ncbi:MAG: GNAT family N-acetyltransferase [Dehalococcoidia bacterium]